MPCEIFHLPARLSSGNSGKRLSIMLAAIVCTIACMAQPATPAHHYDFRKWFRTLAQNRVEYNRYNDRIFQIRDHDQWTRFLQVRARKNHEINLSNRLIIDSINHAVTVDEVLNDRSLYNEFIGAFTLEYLRAGKADPFNTLTLCDAMQHYSDRQPDSLRMDNWLHMWRGVAYFHIFSLDNDTTTFRTAYNHFKAVLDEDNERFPDYKQCRIMALYNLSNFAWVSSKIMTVSQLRKSMRAMRLMLNDTTLNISAAQTTRIKSKAERMDEQLVRNVYLYDSTMMKRAEAEWLMRKLIKAYKRKKDIDDEQYMNMLLMQVKLKQITALKALESYKSRYQRKWEQIKGIRLNDEEFTDFIQQYYSILYLNDIADIPYREKRRTVKLLCGHIVTAFRNRHDDQHSTQFVKMLKTLVVYERITRYLKPEERVAFLEELIVTTDLPTYAHSMHVAEIATTIISAMVKEEPRLLVGYLGCDSERSVTKHKKLFVEYMRRAAEFSRPGQDYHGSRGQQRLQTAHRYGAQDYTGASASRTAVSGARPTTGAIPRRHSGPPQVVQRQGRLPCRLRQHPLALPPAHRHTHPERLPAGSHRAHRPQLQEPEDIQHRNQRVPPRCRHPIQPPGGRVYRPSSGVGSPAQLAAHRRLDGHLL